MRLAAQSEWLWYGKFAARMREELKVASSILTLRLFGKWEARSGDQPLSGLHLREGERLLAYLTLRHGTPLTYRQLAQQFWPSEAVQNAQYDSNDYPSTRQAIRSLRQALGDHAERLKSVSKGIVQLDLEGADVDVIRFEQLVGQTDAAAWQQAIALHHAPLLEGWPEKWAQEACARYQRSYDRITAGLAAGSAPTIATPAPLSAAPSLPRQGERDAPPEADGGAVPLDSPFYVERPTDVAFTQALLRADSIVLVKGAHQAGKTSLLARSLQTARQAGARVALTDFEKFNASQFASLDALYLAIASALALQLDLDVSPHNVWNPNLGPNMNLEWFLRRQILKQIEEPFVWGMDEVDRLFGCEFGGEVFGLFRSWHNARSLDPTGPWARVTLAIAYATEAHLFIADLNQSPFNVGTRLALDDFTPQQIAEMNGRYSAPLKNEAEIARFHALVGGQPYLSRRGMDALAARSLTLEQLEAQGDQEEGPFGNHLRHLAVTLARSPELREAVRAMLSGQFCPVGEPFYRLRAAGILAGHSSQEARFRSRLYASYLSRHLR